MKPFLFLLLAVSLLLSGCETVVVSKNPLSSPDSAVVDPRLEGLWRARDGSYYEYVAFGSHAARGANLIVKFGKSFAKSPGSDQLGWSSSMNFFVTRAKRRNYLNLSNRFERSGVDGEPRVFVRGYMFVAYHFARPGEVVIAELQADFIAKAVKEGKLKGKTQDDGFGPNTFLTDSSEHLTAFIEASKTEEVFGPPQKLFKIGAP
jgi:hypothetical protein